MVYALMDTGQELLTKEFWLEQDLKPADVSVGLYRDDQHPDDTGGQSLETTATLGSISTEPTGESYLRDAIPFGSGFSADKPSSNWRAVMDDVSFDVSDSNSTVNGLFLTGEFQSEDKGDSQANEHLLITIQLQNPRDLSLESGELTFTRASIVTS